MAKKRPFLIEFDSRSKEQEFLNWALSPEKDNSEGIQRARELVNGKKNRTRLPIEIAIRESGGKLTLESGAQRKVRGLTKAKYKGAYIEVGRGIWEDGKTMGVYTKGK